MKGRVQYGMGWVVGIGELLEGFKKGRKRSDLYLEREDPASVFCSYYRALSKGRWMWRLLFLVTMTLVPSLPATRRITERLGVSLGGKIRVYDSCLQTSVGLPWSRGTQADMLSSTGHIKPLQ